MNNNLYFDNDNFKKFNFQVYKVFEWVATINGLWCEFSLAQHKCKHLKQMYNYMCMIVYFNTL